MGVVRPPRPVNLICGLMSNDPDLMARAVRLLQQHQGPTDAVSDLWPFDTTDYYAVEMGDDLQRQFISFERLIDPGQLAGIKLLTNTLEQRVCHDVGLPEHQRRVNLDPGYISLSKLVLATTKDYSHRVYVGSGIYAEATLHYENGRWTAWPWTYPDYAGPRYHAFFDRVREGYKAKLNVPEGGQDTRPPIERYKAKLNAPPPAGQGSIEP
ncbi:MAG: DUF4416 family protein [Planctomycetes bacterium]|nr:DUF4416 family protein [Planctomycetota bacterium]